MNQELIDFIYRSDLRGGCGMSTRPEYYSGEGISSLTHSRMTRIYNEIKRMAALPPMWGQKDVPENAHDEFVKMVLAQDPLTCTGFLLALHELSDNKWVFNGREQPGICMDDAVGDDQRNLMAQVTVIQGLCNIDKDDRTYEVIRAFMRDIDREDEISKHPQHAERVKKSGGRWDPYCCYDKNSSWSDYWG